MKKQLVKWSQSVLKRLLNMDQKHVIEHLKKKGLTVGNNFHMQEGCIIDGAHSNHIVIGNDVSLAPNVHILAHDASTWWFLEHTRIMNTTIGNKVFIGAGSIIMPGVTIGNEVIIGAGSVVTKNVPDNCVYAGNPAKFLMHTNEYIDRERAKMNAENTFDESYSESQNVSTEKKEHLKKMAAKYGAAFLK
ncbi:DapH/DapD/GlmU-related protein [Flavobacterium sp. NRK1]|uniref:acyltransferase n=1 Tax=Flavobacterium sp. NRK1 TaxID=2954929 RepID=UPI0020934A3F|nr:acyltransferase [Flavobacterium sp. NRK1]MCO6147554.1 acyltransferase [Flavobacterium sp. NRK1]